MTSQIIRNRSLVLGLIFAVTYAAQKLGWYIELKWGFIIFLSMSGIYAGLGEHLWGHPAFFMKDELGRRIPDDYNLIFWSQSQKDDYLKVL